MHPISRRTFLTAAGTLGAAVLAEGLIREPTALEVSRHEIPFRGLPAPLAGLRIACLTDVHLHGGVGRAARAAVEHVAREHPDIVVLAGDICNKHSDLPHLTAWARDVRGTLATFATLGNWEHHAGIDRRTAERAYEPAGVELLYNSAARISRAGATLTIVGIDDPVQGEPDLGAALATVGPADRTIWIVHAPGYVDGVPTGTAPRPAAILTGHTHGGQIRLPFYTPYVPVGSGRFLAGWYHDTFAPLYVSRGIGTVFLPARLFCPPELPVFTLHSV
ncbi:MAG TPA: metallophosphoesterase [Gemmatimonadales bacterium]|nr:metallophosphoesterase [Gemmatimonadales bacterium]